VRRTSLLAAASLLTALAIGLSAGAVEAKSKRRPNMPRGWDWPPTPAMQRAGAACEEHLRSHDVEFIVGEGIKVATPLRLPQMRLGEVALEPTWRKGPFVMDCHLARALFEVTPQLRDLGVASLRFSTIHDYRHVRRNGRKTNILSRHAIGLAIDVFEVGLTDGTVLKVKRAYADSEVLKAVEQVFADSERFRNPLTPGVDPKGHDDHFHLEARMPLK